MMIGQMLDRYRIESKLGEGGMGVVYQARDTQLDRVVAIKILPHDKIADPVRKQRFVQEARAASALNHPSIVTIHDIRSDAGIDFIVMEYVAGSTLDEKISTKSLRPGDALRYGVAVADALAKAHEAGIVHRDLKPSNVMVTDEGRIKVLDFGLAKLVEAADSSQDAATRTSPVTEMGVALGTVAYMSPEQAEGHKVDGRSDIFSFGAVLYEMTTGRKPFTGDSSLKILAKVLNDDPIAPGTIASISPDLEKIMLRCLRKDPARRYQSMADLKVALEDVEQESVPATKAHSPLRWLWPAMSAVLVVIAAVLAWRSWRPTERVTPLAAVPLSSLPGKAVHPTFSPDANHVAFTWNGPKQDNADIYVQQIGVGSPLRLTTDPGRDESPVWSPDGRSIAFLRAQEEAGRNEVRLIPPLGGPERRLVEIRQGELLRPIVIAWCPDSSCLVVTDSAGDGQPDALFVVSVESGEKRQLTKPQHPAAADTEPAFSSDGAALVYRRNASPFIGELYRVAVGKGVTVAGEPLRLTATALDASSPTWTPDDRTILFSARGGLWRVAASGAEAPSRLPFVGEDGLMPVVSRQQPGQPARMAYVRSFSDSNIWRVDTPSAGAEASSPPAVAIASTRRDSLPQLSPDGRRVAFVSDRTGESEIWVADLQGTNAVKLTSMNANPGFPRWSPDGNLIAFHSNPEGQAEIYVVSAEGGKPRNLTTNPATDAFPSFSRDGTWMYFSSNRTGGDQLVWKIPVAGGDAVQMTRTPGHGARESPDGADLYYMETLGKPSPVWRVPTSGGAAVKVLESALPLTFAAIDTGIYSIDRTARAPGQPDETRLQYFDFATRTSRTVARNLGNLVFGLTASADGRTILYARVDSSVDDLMLVEHFR